VARKGRSFGFSVTGASLLLATLFFFCFPWLTSRIYPLDFRFLGFLSLLPLEAGWIGLLKRPLEKLSATRVVYGVMLAFAAFCILVDGYMVFLAVRQMV
jgi:1,4-dihydroxy-2-naphthoate octaprenyltransferase